MVGDPNDAQAAFGRVIDVCAAIKAANAGAANPKYKR